MADVSLTRVATAMSLLDVRARGTGSPAVAARLGLAELPANNRVARVAGREVLWLGPDEFLVVAPHDQSSGLAEDCKKAGAGAVVDVSAGWIAFDLEGAAAREVLASSCSLDFHPRSFAVGQVAQTMIAKAPVIIWQRSDLPNYRLLVRPSLTAYLVDWLADAIDGWRASRPR